MTFYTKAAGVTFEGRQQIIRNLSRQGILSPGEKLILQREPNNPYDSFAVAVLASNGQQIGYLPKDCARQVSINMANGMEYQAFVGSVTGGDVGYSYGVNIRIEYGPKKKKEDTIIRFRIVTSGNSDVFTAYVYGCDGENQSNYAYFDIGPAIIMTFQVSFIGHLDTIHISLEEHFKTRTISIGIEKDQIGGRFGIQLEEKPDPYDVPTYAGAYTFYHPLFEFSEVDYNSIPIHNKPAIISMDGSEVVNEDQSSIEAETPTPSDDYSMDDMSEYGTIDPRELDPYY